VELIIENGTELEQHFMGDLGDWL
jgi:hypothetical protein